MYVPPRIQDDDTVITVKPYENGRSTLPSFIRYFKSNNTFIIHPKQVLAGTLLDVYEIKVILVDSRNGVNILGFNINIIKTEAE